MIIQALAFYLFAFVAIAAGVMVVTSRNPVHSVLWLAVRDLASRALPREVTTSYAVGWSMVPMIILGSLAVPFQGGWQPVTLEGGVWLLGIVLAASGALWTLTSSMRVGEVSAVAPFRYTRIVFAMAIAYFVFAESPDGLTWLGVGLIVGSGLYSFFRERRLARSE